jgi:hypothetical protein
MLHMAEKYINMRFFVLTAHFVNFVAHEHIVSIKEFDLQEHE